MLSLLCFLSVLAVSNAFLSVSTKVIPTQLHASSPFSFFSFPTKTSASNVNKIATLKTQLKELVARVQPNGIPATAVQRQEIEKVLSELEKLNPTVSFSFIQTSAHTSHFN
jgi:hypothetical protein